jgi:N-acetylglucosaminyl-diphospho-decaprenol L-rhamnosyltransferase
MIERNFLIKNQTKELVNLQPSCKELRSSRAVALALGIVTYNNSATQLARLLRSIELSVAQLNDGNYDVRLYSIDCGSPSDWATSAIHKCRLPPAGNLGFGRAMNLLMAKAFDAHGVSSFLCVNPDGVLHMDLLREILSSAQEHESSVIEARQFPEEHLSLTTSIRG